MPTLRDRTKIVQREESDKLPDPSPSSLPALQTKSQPQQRPKAKPKRIQPRRVSRDDQLSSPSDADQASSSKLLIQLNKGPKESDGMAKKRPQEVPETSVKNAKGVDKPKSRPKPQPKDRPAIQKIEGSSETRVRNRPSYKEYSDDSEEFSSSQDDSDYDGKKKRKISAFIRGHLSLEEDDYAARQSSENGQASRKAKKTGKKKKGDVEESEIHGRIKIPHKLTISAEDSKLEELDRLLSQHKSMKDDDLLDWQEDSLEFPETSQGLKSCPFCHKDLPKVPSKKLKDLMDYWLKKMKNSAILPSSTSTAECCQLHEGESVHIPNGQKKKWPTKYEKNKLGNRVWKDDILYDRLMNLVVNPEESEFYRRQVRRREIYGRQTESILNQMEYFHEEQAGYYGELGALEIRATIYDFFDEYWEPTHTLEEFTNRPGNWMKESDFIDKVLFPEVVCELIREDEKKRGNRINLKEAEKIRDESNLYGTFMFPIEKKENGTDSCSEQHSPISPEARKNFKGGFGERCTTNSPQIRRKLSYNRSQGDSKFSDEAIEVSSAQPVGSGRRTRQKMMMQEKETPVPPISPSRPRPRPSQSKASQQSQNAEIVGNPSSRIYSSQDRIVKYFVPHSASSPEVQPSSSTVTNANVGLGSSQNPSDRSTPNTDPDQDQDQELKDDGIGLLPSSLDDL